MSKLVARRFSPETVREFLFWSAIGLAYGIGFVLMIDAPLIADEGYHLPQISGFLAGNFEVSPHLTVLPIYHAIMAVVLSAMGAITVADARLANLLVSAISVWVFYRIAARLWPEERYLLTARLAFLPILFPMHFVIYTDGWALLFVLLAVERCLDGKNWQSALAIAIASLIRQPNVVWIVLLWILANTHPSSWRPRLESVFSNWRINSLPFFVLIVGFAALFLMNRGVAVGDRTQHAVSINFANVWFFGLCSFLFFLPEVWAGARPLSRLSRSARLWLALASTAVLVLYLSTYHVLHQYNQPSLWFYLRNRLLYWTTSSEWVRLAVFVPVIFGLALFCFGRYQQPRFIWIVPIALLSILVMPLIEQRYYLVPLVFFLAFGKTQNRGIGWLIFAQVLLAGVALYAISQNYFFL